MNGKELIDTPKSRFYKILQKFYKKFCKIFVKSNFSRKRFFSKNPSGTFFRHCREDHFPNVWCNFYGPVLRNNLKLTLSAFYKNFTNFFVNVELGWTKNGRVKFFSRKIKRHVSHGEAYQFLAPDCHSRSRYSETKCSRGNPPSGPSRRGDLI